MRKQSQLRDKYLNGKMGTAEERSTTVRRQSLRLLRTISLGTVAVVVAILFLGEQYGLDREMMISYLTSSLMFVGFIVSVGLIGFGFLLAVKWLLRR